MSRRSSAEEQQGILLAHRIGFLHFAKQAAGISELRLEFRADFFPNFIAAAVNSGADRCFEILWAAAKTADDLSHAFFHDALHRTAPPGMKNADGMALCINNDHRQTISGLNGKQEAGSR